LAFAIRLSSVKNVHHFYRDNNVTMKAFKKMCTLKEYKEKNLSGGFTSCSKTISQSGFIGIAVVLADWWIKATNGMTYSCTPSEIVYEEVEAEEKQLRDVKKGEKIRFSSDGPYTTRIVMQVGSTEVYCPLEVFDSSGHSKSGGEDVYLRNSESVIVFK